MIKFKKSELVFWISICSFWLVFVQISFAQTTGKIVLEKSTPATAVVVTATQQVVLKPGFRAIGNSTSSFDARIGTANNLSPVMQVASGSTISVPTTPSSSQNYIQTKTFLTASTDENSAEVLSSIQYFDGLGRPTQTVAAGITPSGADLVSHVGYDEVGRQNLSYLPVAVGGNFGLFADNSSISNATSTLYGTNNRPYAETLLEASPLNRVTGQKKPGKDWQTHGAYIQYDTNLTAMVFFRIDDNNILWFDKSYDQYTLFVTTTFDEDDKEITKYTDAYGHVIKTQSGNDASTYYVYNKLGQLAYVLPPAFIQGMGNVISFDDSYNLLKLFAYVYRYDDRGNCIYKKLPGCTPIYMVYDQADRLVLSQDGNQRKKLSGTNAQWTATSYDDLGRVISTGLIYRSETDSAANYLTIRTIFSNTIVNASYTGFSSATPLTVNYYDNYSFLANGSNLGYDNSQEQNGYSAQWANATGLLTGSQVYYLDGSGGSNTTVMYYDDGGHVVQNRASNHLGGYDLVYNQYDFTGKVLKTLKKHKISTSNEISELYSYYYDNGQRLKTTTYSLNGATAIRWPATNTMSWEG